MTQDSPLQTYLHRLQSLRAQRGAAGHRVLGVAAGAVQWVRAVGAAVYGAERGDRLWLGDEATPAAVAVRRAREYLGREFDTVVIDALAGFHPDAVAAVAGCLRAGGVLLVLTPPLASWPDYPDPDYRRLLVHGYTADAIRGRFLRRLSATLGQDSDCWLWQEGAGPPPLPAATATSWRGPGRATQQRRAVAAALGSARGAGPLMLSADRGRGKSAALGMAAGRWLRRRPGRVLVTAARPAATATLFEHAAGSWPGSGRDGWVLRNGRSELRFVAPDALLGELPAADLLLVDEAASIPLPLLRAMARAYPRSVFASTEHGYEGTGRGFSLRFWQALQSDDTRSRRLQLEQPIRWAPDDPLERWLFRALLLDAEPAAGDALPTDTAMALQRLDRDLLARNERLLRALFGLLVAAHYRTTPDDLRVLLDGPNIEVWALRAGDTVAATALVAREGLLPPELARAISAGRRRPRGHLLPQTLAQYCALEAAACARAARVLRIAVHPALQRRGLGSRLLAQLVAVYQARGFDYIGTSFGATEELLRFWLRSGFRPLRLGARRDASSGCYALLMAQGLSAAGTTLIAEAEQRFVHHFDPLTVSPLGAAERRLFQQLAQSG